jgi:hypothetical protein
MQVYSPEIRQLQDLRGLRRIRFYENGFRINHSELKQACCLLVFCTCM